MQLLTTRLGDQRAVYEALFFSTHRQRRPTMLSMRQPFQSQLAFQGQRPRQRDSHQPLVPVLSSSPSSSSLSNSASLLMYPPGVLVVAVRVAVRVAFGGVAFGTEFTKVSVVTVVGNGRFPAGDSLKNYTCVFTCTLSTVPLPVIVVVFILSWVTYATPVVQEVLGRKPGYQISYSFHAAKCFMPHIPAGHPL